MSAYRNFHTNTPSLHQFSTSQKFNHHHSQ